MKIRKSFFIKEDPNGYDSEHPYTFEAEVHFKTSSKLNAFVRAFRSECKGWKLKT